MSKVNKELALNVLQFVGRAFSPIVPVASAATNVIDLAQAAAKIRHNSARQNQSLSARTLDGMGSATLEKAVAFVESHLSSPYSAAKGKMKEDMIASISRQLLNDPRARKLIG